MIVELEPGRQIVISSDPRAETIWLQVCANKGSLGVALTRKDAMALRRMLWDAVMPAKD